ncbi:MAG: DUF2793 domain-containing protein [Pseudomonadota bacterium]
MSTTDLLKLPFIASSQAQKHVTHNEAIRALDALVQLSVISEALLAPPPDPSPGARYLIPSGATGHWSTHIGEIAAWQDGAWAYFVPQAGWRAYVEDDDRLIVRTASGWQPIETGSVNPAPAVGINTMADATNKLAVKSDAVLISHDDVTPGSGDIRLFLNKEAEAATGSLVLQTSFGARAEIGLVGTDDFKVRVTADGVTWRDAIVIDRITGAVSFPNTANEPEPVARSSFGPVKAKIEDGAEDAELLFLSDSTGTASDEWIYRFAVWLAGRYPTHSLTYYLNTGTGYDAGTSLQTGTGPRTIRIYNAASPGFSLLNWLGALFDHAVAPLSPDVMVTNLGINNRTYDQWRIRQFMLSLIQVSLETHPHLPVVNVLQNPNRDDTSMDRVIEALKGVPASFPGLTQVDVHQVFLAAGKPAAWYADSVHPGSAGSQVYVDTVSEAWEEAAGAPGADTFEPWFAATGVDAFDLLDNGTFDTFAGTLPDGWTKGGASDGLVERETTLVYRARPQSLKLTGGASANAFISHVLPDIGRVAGKSVSVAMRVYSDTPAHRLIVRFDGTGAEAANDGFEADPGHSPGGWIWKIIDNLAVPVDATSFSIQVTATAPSSVLYVDRVIVYEGAGRPALL